MGRKRKEAPLEISKPIEYSTPGGGGYGVIHSGCPYCGKLPPYHQPTCPKGIQEQKAGG